MPLGMPAPVEISSPHCRHGSKALEKQPLSCRMQTRASGRARMLGPAQTRWPASGQPRWPSWTRSSGAQCATCRLHPWCCRRRRRRRSHQVLLPKLVGVWSVWVLAATGFPGAAVQGIRNAVCIRQSAPQEPRCRCRMRQVSLREVACLVWLGPLDALSGWQHAGDGQGLAACMLPSAWQG